MDRYEDIDCTYNIYEYNYTCSPIAAAGPLGSTVCTYTGLDPLITNPYPTGSLTTCGELIIV